MPSDSKLDRRTFLTAAGGAAASAALAGCTGDKGTETGTEPGTGTKTEPKAEGPSGTLVYARGDHPTNYDPQQTTSGEVAKVTNQIFDQLIQFKAGSGGKLTAGLASDWTLEGTTATLTLKEGIKFHNGDEFTSSDFRATFRRFTDSDYKYYLGKNASGYGPFTLGNWIESVDDSKKYEVKIQLKQKYAPFLRNLAMFAAAVLSKKQIESLGASPEKQANLGKDPKGTGAFTFKQLDNANQRVLLGANTDFWGKGPNVKQVIFKTITQNSTRAQDVINGASHITDNLDSQSSKQIQNADSATLKSKNGINIGYMAFNMARKKEFRSKKVRQAVSYAVNTKAIVNQIYQGFAKQADQPLPPDVMGYNDSIDPYPQDKQKAKQLLKDAGYGDGFEFQLATFSNPRGYNPSPVETASQVKSDLEDIGLSVTINQFSTFSSYLTFTAKGKHDACFLGWYTDNADPDNFLYVLLDPKVSLDKVPEGQDWISFDTEGYSTLNVSGWANTEYMKLVRDAQSTYDTGARRTKYKKANKLAHDEAPWVFVDYAQTLRAVNEKVVEESYTVSSVGGPYLNTVRLKK